MKILLVGGGGREHAIAWKLSQSSQVTQIYAAPGNGGTATMPGVDNVSVGAADLIGLRDFAQDQAVDLTVVGPEAPLVAGVVDMFHAAGLAVFGPSQAAARLEGSKAFSKQFMQKYNIPTGWAGIFDDFDAAIRYLRSLDEPPVVKASGLAAGKGVLLPESREEAAVVLQRMLLEREFGDAGATVLLEERLSGPEISVLAFTDGEHLLVMPTAQDHKRLLDGDQGPNTGGMGAFAPSPLATQELLAQVEREILAPTLAGLAQEGANYQGVLYAGLMLTAEGPKVLEFNCRLGDPETQVILPLLDGDLAEICQACTEGRLDRVIARRQEKAAVTVVMAAEGYPGSYTTGVEITGVAAAEALGCTVFHAGTKWKEGRLLTDGGRVLAVTAVDDTLAGAGDLAYLGVSRIHFNEAVFRTDIGRSKGSA